MPDVVELTINGVAVRVAKGTTIAAAMLSMGAPCRVSVTGTPRGPLCGMGVCFECRAVVDGRAQLRTCQTFCSDGMLVRTQP